VLLLGCHCRPQIMWDCDQLESSNIEQEVLLSIVKYTGGWHYGQQSREVRSGIGFGCNTHFRMDEVVRGLVKSYVGFPLLDLE
jgi:hypothetical protein